MSRSEELRVRAGDASLAATLVLPDGQTADSSDGPYPNVLLLPSWLPRDRDGRYDRVGHSSWFAPARGAAQPGLLARLAGALAERGVASLRADPRGCGDSDGRWEEVTLFAKIDDARDLLAAIRGRSELDLRRSGIVGHGEGAGPPWRWRSGIPPSRPSRSSGHRPDRGARRHAERRQRAVATARTTSTRSWWPSTAGARS